MLLNNIIIENILRQYHEELGQDFEKYYNHVYRIYNICLSLDSKKENRDKYAIAAAYHDLGIWTSKTFDYLEPSIALAHQYLKKTDNKNWTDEITLMIDMHHKRSKYIGLHQKVVETFRRADWIDVTKCKKSFGFGKTKYREIVNNYPYLGLHKFLIFQTLKNFIKAPLNPLPMFKK